MDKTLLLIFIVSTLETYQTIYVTVCDCKNTKTRGILDINSPYYCEKESPDSRQHQPRFQTSYTLMTKQKLVKTWKGWTSTMQLYKLYKNTLSSCMDQTNIDSWACNEYATTKRSKNSIQQEVKFLLNQPFEEELGKRLYSISYAWGSIRLGHPKLTRNENKEKQDTIIYIKISDAQKQVTVHNQYDIEEKLPNGTDFEYLVDQTIRIRNTSTCITITETNNIIPEPCSENTSRWVFDTINYQLISMEKHLCITLKDEDEGSNQSLILRKCSRPENMDDNQQWVFQTVNTNPEVLENFPETTIDELD
ncbi:hypothetical protein GHT06_015162 [Daphnia sinensis]|uniref:Ricin B lectin domain-containing protein n=1 Tax=Daphnia sinensis TaxID=1820382 RepID=A0AAD5L941_9CRUS|nr:hypothetical protein GHT06_015162 [Daphnia sinensis]